MGRLKCPFAYNFFAVVLAKVAQVYCNKGCSFETSYELVRNPEPQGNPLILDLDILIIGLRDVADSGGSYGVDVEYDLIGFYALHYTSVFNLYV